MQGERRWTFSVLSWLLCVRHPQRLFSKDDPQQYIACSIPHLMPIGITQTCMCLYISGLARHQVFEKTVCLPGSAFADLPLPSHQHHSSAPSRIWVLQFSPRSLNMFAHCLCWIVKGLCTALDSSTSTDYPNSHKLILVIADCMAKVPEIHWRLLKSIC